MSSRIRTSSHLQPTQSSSLAGFGTGKAEPVAFRAMNVVSIVSCLSVLCVTVTVGSESKFNQTNPLHRQLGSCNRPGLVDCGDCKCVEPSTCRWCHGMGGVGGTSGTSFRVDGTSCGVGLVNCGICRCTERSSCATCNGQGGPAAIISGAPPLPWFCAAITWIFGILRS